MSKYFKIIEHITFEPIDKNIYILNIENGEYYKLSESASLIWKEIEEGHCLEEIKINLNSMFDENHEIDNDIDEVISNFIDLGFIIGN